jgi:hypothetical protein
MMNIFLVMNENMPPFLMMQNAAKNITPMRYGRKRIQGVKAHLRAGQSRYQTQFGNEIALLTLC